VSTAAITDEILSELRARLDRLEQTRAAGEFETLERDAHTLKGSALLLGLDDLAVALTALRAELAVSPDGAGVVRSLATAARALELELTERRLRTLRHDLRNDLGKVMMAAGLLELELSESQASRAQTVTAAASVATGRVDEITIAPAQVPSPNGQTASERRDRTGLTALVVDDDHVAAAAVVAALRGGGVDVIIADDLDTARGLLGERSFDVAVVDIHLGGDLGTALLPDLRTHAVRAVAFTGDAAAAGDGWDAVVEKGAAPATLLAALVPTG
jgi:HPt (histidine-containing phosphotransfer) domain-containing protein/CheY-like chemotaxis protein